MYIYIYIYIHIYITPIYLYLDVISIYYLDAGPLWVLTKIQKRKSSESLFTHNADVS